MLQLGSPKQPQGILPHTRKTFTHPQRGKEGFGPPPALEVGYFPPKSASCTKGTQGPTSCLPSGEEGRLTTCKIQAFCPQSWGVHT